jgi:hypothetical protein
MPVLRPFLTVFLIVAIAAPASAEWTRAQRARFLDSCLESCRSAPNLPEARKGACDKTCGCVADEVEMTVTPDEMYAVEEAAAAGKTTPKMEELRSFFPACARKAMRRPQPP